MDKYEKWLAAYAVHQNINTENGGEDETMKTSWNASALLEQFATIWLSTWTYAFVMGGMNLNWLPSKQRKRWVNEIHTGSYQNMHERQSCRERSVIASSILGPVSTMSLLTSRQGYFQFNSNIDKKSNAYKRRSRPTLVMKSSRVSVTCKWFQFGHF